MCPVCWPACSPLRPFGLPTFRDASSSKLSALPVLAKTREVSRTKQRNHLPTLREERTQEQETNPSGPVWLPLCPPNFSPWSVMDRIPRMSVTE